MKLEIIYSKAEPLSKEALWITKEGNLIVQKIFTAQGWKIINSTTDIPVTTSYNSFPYTFEISDSQEALDSNKQVASNIGLDTTVNVHIIGKLYGINYDTVGVYHNGEISAVQGDTHIVLDVNFNTGEITMHSYYDLSTYIEGVELEIGNSDEVMSRNLEKLRRVTVKTNVFHTHIDYGIGVGSWTDNVGGFAHITTAQGHEAYYDINANGSVLVNENYVSPTSLYGKYKTTGGIKSEEDFYNELINLIG